VASVSSSDVLLLGNDYTSKWGILLPLLFLLLPMVVRLLAIVR
jgi:hypothetical protein